MSPREELEALRRLAELEAKAGNTKPKTQREIAEDAMNRGFGSGLPKFAYDLGGKVTDLTGSPEAGVAANFLTHALPAALTSARLPEASSSLLEGPSRWLMQNSVKPSTAQHSAKEVKEAMKTMLAKNIYPTQGGMDKASRLIGGLNDQVEQAIAKSSAKVNVGGVAERLQDPMKRFGLQVNPQSDVAAIEDVWTKFLTNPHVQGKTDIPVQLAHELKKGTYKALAGKYGEVGSAATEGQKALARGFREEVAAAVPEVVDPLKQEAALMNVREMATARALQQGNNNPLGLAALRADHLPSAALTMADRIAAIKAFIAMQMFGAAKPGVLAPAGVTGGVLGNQEPRGLLYP